jgi:copper homeostasis protein (lipoprotein)
MRIALRLASLLLISLTAACGGSDTARDDAGADGGNANGAAAGDVPARDIAALAGAASWVGEIPCADCAGIRTTITLYPDGTFRTEGVYLGTGGKGDTTFTDLGRWTHTDSARRVVLRGSTGLAEHYAVEPGGALTKLDRQGQRIAGELNYSLTAVSRPVDITHPARLIGAFTYMADAATIVECGNGLQFPVDMSGEYITLERAYTALTDIQPGDAVVVRLKGHLAERPAMEGSGTTLSLVVDSMDRIDPLDGCAAQATLDVLSANNWRLVSLSGPDGDVALPDDTKASLKWERYENRFSGHGGCNGFSAPATFRGTTLTSGPAVRSEMACSDSSANAAESRFLAVIDAGGSVRLDRDTLVFSQGPRDVARFVRVVPTP